MKKKCRTKNSFEFSKLIILFETLIVGFVTYKTMGFIGLAILNNYQGTLPYLVTTITAVWGAYGASVGFYYNKAKAENTKKIDKAPIINPNQDCD